MKFFKLFIEVSKEGNMGRINSNMEIFEVVYRGVYYVDWETACEIIGAPRTSILRQVKKHDLLLGEDVLVYKNRQLLRTNWVFNFWKNLSEKTMGK